MGQAAKAWRFHLPGRGESGNVFLLASDSRKCDGGMDVFLFCLCLVFI